MPRITYGEKYTVNASGAMWKPIKCSNCNCNYAYLVKHSASGTAENPLWLNRQGSINRAEDRAHKNLEKQIKKINLNYYCPECGYYQPEMIRRMRFAIFKKSILFGTIAGIFSTLFMGIVSTLLLPAIISEPQWLNFLIVSISILCGIGFAALIFFVFLLELVNFNPNKNAASRKNKVFSESYPVTKL